MAIEAPISKFKTTNIKIYIAFCIIVAAWCAYDGYFNEKWIKEHTEENGNPKTYLVFNRRAPYFLIGGVVILGAYLYKIRNKKVVAAENELIINGNKKIQYDAIQKIDKTHFESKGFFIITYNNETGKENSYKLSDKTYDNLSAILDHLIAKIS